MKNKTVTVIGIMFLLQVVLPIALLLSAFTTVHALAAPVQNDLHNLAVAKVIKTVDYPGNYAVFDVDLQFAEHLYNIEDPYLVFLPVGTTAEPGDMLMLTCTTDPTEWVANILDCDLVTVIN